MSAQQHGVNFAEFVAGPQNEGIVSAVLVALVITALGFAASKRLAKHDNPLVPDDKLTLRNILELVTEFVVKLGDNVMGRHNRKYLPFVATLFFYILMMNFLGLLPGFSMPTDSGWINGGLALTVFVLYNYWGIREVGIRAYLKHLWGPIWWLGVILFPIEIISHCVRPLSLSLRLFGNMQGDHTVLTIFLDLTKYWGPGIPVAFYVLGTFVCCMQAFVFTLLTMIYIRFAVAHEEEH